MNLQRNFYVTICQRNQHVSAPDGERCAFICICIYEAVKDFCGLPQKSSIGDDENEQRETEYCALSEDGA